MSSILNLTSPERPSRVGSSRDIFLKRRVSVFPFDALPKYLITLPPSSPPYTTMESYDNHHSVPSHFHSTSSKPHQSTPDTRTPFERVLDELAAIAGVSGENAERSASNPSNHPNQSNIHEHGHSLRSFHSATPATSVRSDIRFPSPSANIPTYTSPSNNILSSQNHPLFQSSRSSFANFNEPSSDSLIDPELPPSNPFHSSSPTPSPPSSPLPFPSPMRRDPTSASFKLPQQDHQITPRNIFHNCVLRTQQYLEYQLRQSPTFESCITAISCSQQDDCTSRNGPLTTDITKYPVNDDDIDQVLEHGQGFDQSEYNRMKQALNEELHKVRESAKIARETLLTELYGQRIFRPVTCEEWKIRSSFVLSKFLLARRQIIEKFQVYARIYKGLDAAVRPRRGTLSKEQGIVLKTWLFGHFHNPYPDESDKQYLAIHSRLTLSQINNWFINARVRIVAPCRDTLTNEKIKREGL